MGMNLVPQMFIVALLQVSAGCQSYIFALTQSRCLILESCVLESGVAQGRKTQLMFRDCC